MAQPAADSDCLGSTLTSVCVWPDACIVAVADSTVNDFSSA